MSAAKKRGLGRGLEALLGPKGMAGAAAPAAVEQPQPGDVMRTLPVERLQPGKYQPRRDMDPGKLDELSASIQAQGVIQPIVVRQIGKDRYEIVAGERRWRASKLAGLSEVPVVLRELDDRTVIAMALIENIQREDLNPLEEAQALQRLIDEFSLTHAEAAAAVGRSRAAVSNLLRLLDLPPAIRALVEARRLEMGHARALLTLSPELAGKLAHEAAENGWSVREVEHRAQQFAAGKVPAGNGARKARAARPQQPDIASLETELSESLGAKVAIAHARSGKGRLVIHYTDLDTLDGVLERLRNRQG
ncbi:chromosome partitioning protein ParB [Pseudoxanthomonas broegbernensis]|uniref:Probable chromosome-partitioning protein ParB n=1 Tax=Pseudoxanthomonas broegbernensis TaxID=83619 RepID=A0A7V8GLA8_9GAMM|nr:ParB/RepB/Spo0J family partition protein [Pseudoxanthomonas broegbernensis]KAF1685681.1 chromosome partitioning protein ParB [Pseudoxanthomonas broegbernensis]MBB6066023.1 ParB family chromosome partitioning protein [Pseudoxanthomonas broegbernensis]